MNLLKKGTLATFLKVKDYTALSTLTVATHDDFLEKEEKPEKSHRLEPKFFYSTIQKEISYSGIGLFTGYRVNMKLLPVPQNTGVVFQRIDLPERPLIPAELAFVKQTPRCTILGKGDVFIQTVEHLLSALKALHVDNLLVQLDGPEVPVGDGSAQPFIELLEQAGISLFSMRKSYFYLKEPVFWSSKETHLVALPSSSLQISYTLHYPHSSFLGSQYFSLEIDPLSYKQEIANCRTFSLYEEIAPLLEKKQLQGASLQHGVVIKEGIILNPEGIRFPNEMVRHKILDLLGDLSLLGIPFLAHIIAIRSGHFSNIAFAKKLQKFLVKGET